MSWFMLTSSLCLFKWFSIKFVNSAKLHPRQLCDILSGLLNSLCNKQALGVSSSRNISFNKISKHSLNLSSILIIVYIMSE